ncbi:hypothetical protein PPL_12364 [Heterostelium album PN500]|uniref:COI1 F-box domain-containing protein n=1 Tax=Heterostelium pallidum (strain ATCC 26659 / Pp 5 / PN500) TaxID=670386 RepID=D3BME4_HETP5|nr:hypothetical protein PPL_12364 [Heterostelium album PN500]EFA77156.1 hypothetical protein PPL_12364 [Heterostelium album PN500]|eukprot:XP_020429285.1 hypothetical protein PPL_12364 [Heterostelium album PN500]
MNHHNNNNKFSINNNTNNNNVFVNLSHLLLSAIVNELEVNLDRICFSLVCKRWFQQRDKYLLFNADKMIFKSLSIDNNDFENFHLNSYCNQLEHSKLVKSNCDLYIYNSNDRISYCPKIFDYNHNLLEDNLDKLNISYSVNKLILSGSIEKNQLESLKDRIDESNIHYIDFGHEFNHSLNANFLSHKIQSIRLSYFFDHALEIGSLPSSLPGLLPAGLKELNFNNVLHNNLLVSGSLPKSLESISNIPCSWLANLKDLPLLKKIKFFEPLVINQLQNPNDNPNMINVGDIPNTITDLHFGFNCNYKLTLGVIPQSIQHLNLNCSSIPFLRRSL